MKISNSILLPIFLYFQQNSALKYGLSSNNEIPVLNDKRFQSIIKKRSISENNSFDFTWQLPQDYDFNVPPWEYKHLTNSTLPWNLHFVFSIFEIQEIDDQKRTILLNMYSLIYWLEPRIKINSSANDWTDNAKGNMSFIPLNEMDRFWQPDLDISSVKTYDEKTVLKEMASFKVNQTKWLRYSARVDLTITCHMNFEDYPFDSHNCPFKIGSYYNSARTVNCTSEVQHDNEQQPILNYVVNIQPLRIEDRIYHMYGEDWATCGFNIKLQRTRIQNFFEVYLTCMLLVIISWISFIIHPEVVPGRMGLLVTILLVLINIFIGIKNKAPISSSLNAFDVYLIICITQVFVACLEYAAVLLRMDFEEKISPALYPTQVDYQRFISFKKESKKEKSKAKRNNLDRFSLMLFPIVYIFMISVYFFSYADNSY